jgi:hypothetical protein
MGVRSVPVVIADLVRRADLTPLKGQGPEVAHDPRTSSLPEFTNPNGAALFSTPVSNPAHRPGTCSSMQARRAHWLTRDNLERPLQCLTNSRQIQHWTEDLGRRMAEHRNPN